MATLTVIDESNAPAKPSAGAAASKKRQAEYEGYLKAVKNGQVGKLVPATGETTRSLLMRLSRAATRASRTVDAWAVDGAVYFKGG